MVIQDPASAARLVHDTGQALSHVRRRRQLASAAGRRRPGDAAQWLALDARRQRQARWRWPVLIGGTIVLAAGTAALAAMPGLALWRLLVLAAALDIRVELRGYELKGVGTSRRSTPVCAEYGNGNDDETLAACADMFAWLYGEGQKRSKRIAHYASLGKAPENKVTPELSALPGSGLHPLIVFVDEIQELFLFGKTGKAAGETAEKCIKLFRALGIWLILGTQIPDRDSLPPGITRNINTRFCLSVADQVANDMILGTSAYKLGHRATVFEPVTEAGWGILAEIGKPGARRSFYVDNDARGQGHGPRPGPARRCRGAARPGRHPGPARL